MNRNRWFVTGVSVVLGATQCSGGESDPTAIFELPCDGIEVVSKLSAEVLLGRSVPLVATVMGPALTDQTVGLQVPIRWTSSNAAVLPLSSNSARAERLGTSLVKASACGETDTVSVAVIQSGYFVTVVSGPTGDNTLPLEMNDSGDVIARTATPPFRPFLWRNGEVTDLGDCFAVDINHAGQILCQGGGPTIWEAGVKTKRDTISANAAAINDEGHVAIGKYLWRGTANFSVPNASFMLTGINVRDDVIARTGDLYPSPVLVRGTEVHALGKAGRYAFPNAVNDSGDVAESGEAQSPYGTLPTALVTFVDDGQWHSEMLRHFVGPLINDIASGANDINNAREVVGSGSQGGFVWRNGRLTLLSNVVTDGDWTVTTAVAINNRGKILAQGVNSKTGKQMALLLDPP